MNQSYTKDSHSPNWNREHTWPRSYGFPDEGDIPHNDCHHLRAADETYNGWRSDKPFDETGGGTELVTVYNNGVGGGAGTYPGNFNWYLTNEFEVWNFRKGDVARSLLYMDVRYEGGIHAPTGGTSSGLPWINEIHYDDATKDTDEGVEIAGPAGLDLSGYSLVAYNGSGYSVYSTTNLTGTLSNQQECTGTLWFVITGLQNGSPDGIALVSTSNAVIQFLSYEGSFTAADGPAAGMASVDIGVTETNTTPSGYSLQFGGTGCEYADFMWQAEQPHTRGAVNLNQVFGGCCSTPVQSAMPSPSQTRTPTPGGMTPSQTSTLPLQPIPSLSPAGLLLMIISFSLVLLGLSRIKREQIRSWKAQGS